MHSQEQAGFTLIELLMTVAVAAVLSAVAAPSLRHVLIRSHLIEADNRLIGALNFARSSAVHSGESTLLCPSSDGLHCSNSQSWQRGWLVAQDSNNDGQPDSGPLEVFDALAVGIRVHSSRGRLRVRYHADGSAPGSNLSLILCHPGQPGSVRSVVVSNSGRARQGTASAAQASACSNG